MTALWRFTSARIHNIKACSTSATYLFIFQGNLVPKKTQQSKLTFARILKLTGENLLLQSWHLISLSFSMWIHISFQILGSFISHSPGWLVLVVQNSLIIENSKTFLRNLSSICRKGLIKQVKTLVKFGVSAKWTDLRRKYISPTSYTIENKVTYKQPPFSCFLKINCSEKYHKNHRNLSFVEFFVSNFTGLGVLWKKVKKFRKVLRKTRTNILKQGSRKLQLY